MVQLFFWGATLKLTKRTKLILQIAGAIVAVKLLVILIVYGTNFLDPISRSLKQFYPAKIVGWHMVSVYDSQMALQEARKLNVNVTKEQVLTQLVQAEKMRNLAQSMHLRLTSDSIA